MFFVVIDGREVSPYDLTGKVEELAYKHQVENLSQFKGKLAGNRKPEEIAENAWSIKKIAERYSTFKKTMDQEYSLIFSNGEVDLTNGCRTG